MGLLYYPFRKFPFRNRQPLLHQWCTESEFLEILVQTLEGFCPVVCGGKVLFNVGAIGSGQSNTQRIRTQTVLIVVVIPDLSDCLSQFLRLVGIRDLECVLIGVGNIRLTDSSGFCSLSSSTNRSIS